MTEDDIPSFPFGTISAAELKLLKEWLETLTGDREVRTRLVSYTPAHVVTEPKKRKFVINFEGTKNE